MRGFAYAALATLCLCVYTSEAAAHSFYDPWCCNEGDCGPMRSAREVKGRWHYTNHRGNEATVLPGYTRILESKDGLTHACIWNESGDPSKPSWKLRCLYVPGGN